MLVEKHSRIDALDMSWVRFWESWRSVKKLVKIERGDLPSSQDDLDDQLREKPI